VGVLSPLRGDTGVERRPQAITAAIDWRATPLTATSQQLNHCFYAEYLPEVVLYNKYEQNANPIPKPTKNPITPPNMGKILDRRNANNAADRNVDTIIKKPVCHSSINRTVAFSAML
jgi:hypothetical protein